MLIVLGAHRSKTRLTTVSQPGTIIGWGNKNVRRTMLLHLTSFLARNGQGRRFPRRVVPAQKVLLTFPASPLDMPPDAISPDASGGFVLFTH